MSKSKDEISNLRKKFFDKKKELQVEEAEKELAESMNLESYTIMQDPDKHGRHFLIVKMKFDIKTKTAIIAGIKNFEDKAAGLAFVMNTSNLKYLYEKNKERS